jgi:hypothetical protein
MARLVGKIACPNGTYMKDGVEKTKWLNVGVLLETDKGFRIKLDCMPIDPGEGWFQVFEEDKQAQPVAGGFRDNPAPAAPAPEKAGEPDIPF